MEAVHSWSVLMLVGALVASGCGHVAEHPGPFEVSFHAQPDATELASWQQSGIDTVINLRMPDEMDWDEAAAAQTLGLEYHLVPVSRSGPGFDAAAIETITAIVDASPGRRVALHCSSGNRAAAWLAIYLVNRGAEIEAALVRARSVGLTRPELEVRVREYLETQ